MSEVVFAAQNKGETDRLVAVVCLGVIQAIRAGAMNLDEAGHQLFWPWAGQRLRKVGVGKNTLEMLRLGLELDGVASLTPDQLPQALAEVERKAIALLEKTKRPYQETERWLRASAGNS